ncbi:MAG: alpha/beta fold hydrolase [Longimicrobiales bacterium]
MRSRQVLFIQGGGPQAYEWDQRLVDSLKDALGPYYEIRYPQMPNEGDPRYAEWKAVLEREFAALDDRAVLVGHSLGGTVLINAVAEQAAMPLFGGIVLLAAPFVGEGGWRSDELDPPRDLGARLPEGMPIHIYHGLDDDTVPPSHAELYARAIPHARLSYLPGRDHQLNDDLKDVGEAIRALAHGEE